MNDTSAHSGALEKTSGRRQTERTRHTGRLGWADVDRQIEVRARIVVTLDALETGDFQLAEDVLFQLLDDLDGVEAILGRAA